NSTGVYAGVVAQGNGNTADTSNINATFARGITLTDSDGVAYFETLVPGHYTGRANHIHIMATINATVLANNTLSGGSISHVGQVFFDQDLLTTVEATSPYSSNTQNQTQNKDDSILGEETVSMDPFLNYVLLGSDVSEGVLGWISIGIDPSKEYNITSAASWTQNGGVAN
ncbi:aromatic compound dioxygenase, partial [Pholiota conissans]